MKTQRQTSAADNPWRRAEAALAGLVSAGLDHYRDLRDATSELRFLRSLRRALSALLRRARSRRATCRLYRPIRAPSPSSRPRSTRSARAAIRRPWRAAELLERRGAPVPLCTSRPEGGAATKEYAELLPELSAHDWKLVRSRQDIIVRFEPERALSTPPELLVEPPDRERFLRVLDKIANDRELVGEPTPDQLEMVTRIRKVLLAA